MESPEQAALDCFASLAMTVLGVSLTTHPAA